MEMDPVTWWTAFGAIAQAAGAVATFAAVALSLYLAQSERALKGRGQARIMISFAGDGSPGINMVHFDLENSGLRPLTWQSVSWRVGWIPWNIWGLGYQLAIQNFTRSIFDHKQVIEPSQSGQMYMPVSQMKPAVLREKREGREFFQKKHKLFGYPPIAAYAQIAGRKPIRLKVSKQLKHFVRTGDHPNLYEGSDKPNSPVLAEDAEAAG